MNRTHALILCTATLLACGTLNLAVAQSPAQKPHVTIVPNTENPDTRLKAPAQVDKDRFSGTWARISIGEKQAVLIRKAGDGTTWQLRLIWKNSEGFEIDTNWDERHEYTYKGYPGIVELKIDQERSSDDRLVVNYFREQQGARKSTMTESGDLVVYRSGTRGRQLVWFQEKLVQDVAVGEALYPDEQLRRFTDRRLWLFEKSAERALQWDEIYW